MNLNKKDSNIINEDINIINDIEKEEEYAYIIDSKNILQLEEPKSINEKILKFFGLPNDTNEEDIINQSTNSSTTNSLSNLNIENNAQKLMIIFTEKLFPKCNCDGFLISKKISQQYFKKNNLDKKKLEENVNYFYNIKQKLAYSGELNFDLNIIKNMGYILMASYNMLNDYKIYDRKALKQNIKKTNKAQQNVIIDYLTYCNSKKIIPDNYKKTRFWEKNSQKYYLPGIFIFLINSLEQIETINIEFNDDINLKDEFTSNDYIDFLAICIYNIQYIFTKVSQIKLNLIHTKLQCRIYSKYFDEYYKALKDVYGNLKKKYLKLEDIYDKKWDFKTEFLLDEYRKIHKNETIEKKKKMEEEKKNKDDNISKTKTNLLNNINEIKNNIKNNIKNSRMTFSGISGFFQRLTIQVGDTPSEKLSLNKKNSDSIGIMELNDEEEEKELSNNNPDIIYKKIEFIDFLKCIFLITNSINRFSNLCKLDLILNDSYYIEFYNFFENEIFDQENKSINMPMLKDFHLIDIISNKFMKLNTLNMEINSLDFMTFKKVLEGIYISPYLISLYLSLFSSDVTYIQQSIYKLYKLNDPNININPISQTKFKGLKWREDSELKILDKLVNNFCTNLQILFNLIRTKNIQILGFNFDIPDIILEKQKYIIIIIKFILNLLLYATKKDTIIQKLVILATKIKFNKSFYPFIDNLLGSIDTKENNKIMKELSFRVQLYQIMNIKNLIGENLIILSLGDCDIHTFKELVQYLTSYKFCTKSLLSKLSISLVKSIFYIDKEIYNLLFKIFNIKIKQLKELNIYSNIIITNIKIYLYLLNIFNDNWISSCTLTLNKKSENTYNLKEGIEERKKIKYLVPDCLETTLLSPEDNLLKKKINEDKIVNKNDDTFWYLKYIFDIKYLCINKNNKYNNESLAKYLTNNILKYIHFQKDIVIKHNLDKEQNE